LGHQFSAQLVKTVMPLASELSARREIPRLRSLYSAGTRITLAAFIPVALVMSVLAGPILEAWVGAEYAGSAPLVVVLAVAGLLGTSQWTGQSIMEGLAEHRPIAIAQLLGGLGNIALSILLVGPMGLMGVALGTLIPTIGVSCGVIPFVMRRLGVSFRQAMVEVWLPVLLPALPAGVLIHVIGASRFAGGIPTLLIASAVGGAVYAALYLAFPGTSIERGAVRGALRASARLVPGLRPR
jgi:O-antigen/teichoic acid export membrane protein